MFPVHLIKIPTERYDTWNYLPYCHFADFGHRPYLEVSRNGEITYLSCHTLFKLKPNVQSSPRNRIDIYMSYDMATNLGKRLEVLAGKGDVAPRANANPEDYRIGGQALPVIGEQRSLRYFRAEIQSAGISVAGRGNRLFIDREAPHQNHVEMQGDEIHIGVQLDNIAGHLNMQQVEYHNIPESELRVRGEHNPVPKAKVFVKILLFNLVASDLGRTLLSYTQNPP